MSGPFVRKMTVGLSHVGAGLLNLLFPKCCPGCNLTLVNLTLPVCPHCMRQLERAAPDSVRAHIDRLPGSEAIDAVFALWVFDKSGTVQRIHQALKYKNKPYHGIALGKLLARTFLLPLPPHRRPDLILPIPLHRLRLLERGYNQSALLATGISSASKIKLSTRALVRTAYTQTQTGLDQHERLKNVASAFAVKEMKTVAGKHVLLVDDVLTTGATLVAAAHPLLGAGAQAVSVMTLAFTRP